MHEMRDRERKTHMVINRAEHNKWYVHQKPTKHAEAVSRLQFYLPPRNRYRLAAGKVDQSYYHLRERKNGRKKLRERARGRGVPLAHLGRGLTLPSWWCWKAEPRSESPPGVGVFLSGSPTRKVRSGVKRNYLQNKPKRTRETY